jgi:hypothetical protein
LAVIWESSALSLHDTISLSIERKKPPSYFKTLLDTLRVLIQFFYADKAPQDEVLLKMEAQLQLYASDSNVLISRYLNKVALEEAPWVLEFFYYLRWFLIAVIIL